MRLVAVSAVSRSLISLVAFCLVLPLAAAEPAVAGALHADGTASTFQSFGGSITSIRGGAYKHTIACNSCLIRIAFTTVDGAFAQDGGTEPFIPGSYEIREFRGTFSYTPDGPGNIHVLLDGQGFVTRLS